MPRVLWGKALYEGERSDSVPGGRAGGKILVGVDTVTGFFAVEGSTLLWDELCAVRGLDERDISNVVAVAQYIAARERLGLPVG